MMAGGAVCSPAKIAWRCATATERPARCVHSARSPGAKVAVRRTVRRGTGSLRRRRSDVHGAWTAEQRRAPPAAAFCTTALSSRSSAAPGASARRCSDQYRLRSDPANRRSSPDACVISACDESPGADRGMRWSQLRSFCPSAIPLAAAARSGAGTPLRSTSRSQRSPDLHHRPQTTDCRGFRRFSGGGHQLDCRR